MMAFLFLMCLAWGCLVIEAAQPNNIFILGGQSNMAGRGGVIKDKWDGVVPRQCQPNPSVFRFSGELTWVEAKEPLHKDIDANKTCGISPGMAFANSVLSKKSMLAEIGLVPCAIGGTNIKQWARGAYLYNQLVNRTTAAMRGGGILRALLWYQGESDTVKHKDAELYKKRLEEFLTNVRDDLNAPTLTVIQVALASGVGRYVEMVREAQLGTKLPGVVCIDAKGLELEPDNLHLTTQAQVQLGGMFADAFLQTPPMD